MDAQALREQRTSQLRRLYWASYYSTPEGSRRLAQKINRVLAGKGLVQDLVRDRFASEGASAGRPWAPLKPATIKQRIRLGFAPGPILRRSATLQAAAAEGKISATADAISLAFCDGPAPRYVGRGQARKRRVDSAAVSARNAERAAIGEGIKRGEKPPAGKWTATGRLSDYAGALNSRRPFFGQPTAQELAPLLRERDTLIRLIVEAIVAGGKVSEVL